MLFPQAFHPTPGLLEPLGAVGDANPVSDFITTRILSI